MARVSLRSLAKAYEAGATTIRDLNLEIGDEEFIVLVGPSGCGKSTTLRMIAGFEDPSMGEIWIDGTRVDELDPRDRDIAMVFQNYALYPHMTVAENMGFGLKMRGMPKADIRRRVTEAAEILGIGALLDRRPKTLSGGQRQRVAMGRAIVRDPKVFLFDEPLSNLDAKLRGHMRTEIKRLQRSLKTTTIYVTHDQVEAMTLADRIVVLNNGDIEQIGSPQDLYSNPATRFVASFIGSPTMNFIGGQIADARTIVLNEGTRLPIPADRQARYAPYIGKTMIAGIRPEHLRAVSEPSADTNAVINVRVDLNEPLGAETLVHFKVDGAVCCASVDPGAAVPEGTVMPFTVAMDKIHLIDPTTDRVV